MLTIPFETDGFYLNALRRAGRNLAVQDVTLNQDDPAQVIVNLTGSLVPGGVCVDAQVQAQLLLTIFQHPEVQSAVIFLEGRNLKQLLDASGLANAASAYRRSEFVTN
ncbi:MAG: hypothetical protein HC915_19720 [Anaerolineae bacterium]|nr:hypothetical protein [Anaerolineae bacterium]